MRRALVTGLGCLTALGESPAEFAAACFAGELGFRKSSRFEGGDLKDKLWGEIPGLSSKERERELIRAALEGMMRDADVSPAYFARLEGRAALFIGSFLYSVDNGFQDGFRRYFGKEPEERKLPEETAKPVDFSTYARKLLGIKGTVWVASSSCASGTTAVGMALDYICQGFLDAAVVLGFDPLSTVNAYGFHALKSLSKGIASPYDEGRDGINIGECGAALLMESEQAAIGRKAKVYAEVRGFALSNDAYHITGPDPEGKGARRVMEAALKDAGLAPEEIDYVNGHGTGTIPNDAMETKAIAEVFSCRNRPLYLSSTKAVLGHTMGAAGVIELISTILSMKEGRYIPLPRLQSPIALPKHIIVEDKTREIEIRHAISNSFGFAGANAAVIVSRVRENADHAPENGGGKTVASRSCPRTSASMRVGIPSKIFPLYIRGAGIVSRCGIGVDKILQAYKDRSTVLSFASEAPIAQFVLSVPKVKIRRSSHYTKLAAEATAACLADAGMLALGAELKESVDASQIGTVLSTSYGALSSCIEFGDALAIKNPLRVSPALFAATVPNSCLGQIALLFGLTGASTMLTGGNPLEYAGVLLARGHARMTLCGGVEEYLGELSEALALTGELPEKTMADGAGMLLLSREEGEDDYGAVTQIGSCTLPRSPYLYRLDAGEARPMLLRTLRGINRPELVITSANGSYFDDIEANAIHEAYGDVRTYAAKQLFGETFSAGLIQNVALAAALLKAGDFRDIVATGIDLHGNYAAARLEIRR